MTDTRDGDDPPGKRPRLALPRPYEVGYGKPPVSTRFRPGRSGNPGGRPRGSKNRLPAMNEERLKTIVMEEAYRPIKVRDGERNITVPMATAVVRALAVSAAKGNNRAAALFTQMVKVVEDQNSALHSQWLDAALDYKLAWQKELARRKGLKIEAPDPVPHPDDVVIDMRTGTVRILGPLTMEEKQLWDAARELKEDLSASIEEGQSLLREECDPEERNRLVLEIDGDRKVLEQIEEPSPIESHLIG
jgi:hypothetical protein